MVTQTLEFSDRTLKALFRLAEFTGVEGDESRSVAKLIQDALRVYEWIIRQQSEGNHILALQDADLRVLRDSDDVHGMRDELAGFLSPRQQDRAAQYFRQHAS